jgi:hypothetical protein
LVLQQAIELDETLAGEIVQIHDDLAVGPIENIHIGEGMEARRNWWSTVLGGGDYEGEHLKEDKNDLSIIANVVGNLRRDENEQIWIWAAQNKHDVCGYYWLLHYVKEFQGRVFTLYLNNLPFLNDKGQVFYPNWLHEIPAKEFLKAKKLAREITLSEFEVDPDEWAKLCSENGGVRLLEGGKKLISEPENFYDAELKKFITADWQKASKVIHTFLSKAKHTTGDSFLLWRLKLMIEQGLIDMQGKLGNMKDFEVKTKN